MKINNQYLNPDMVLKYGVLNKNGYKNLTIYEGSIYNVCPNPDNLDKCKNIENQYLLGSYLSKNTYSLTKEQFEDLNFWKS
jgi:hypothetical protein